ncbi:tRNA guanosine(34) transglycosylase Tgt [Rubinisphaera sp.]|uniref:tRNA guanosine(34) transglycosylase Tgt n=1 Tax=Rubinisphaera sp. TaxID=2024857 RepID=UPI000C103778|nr:tRNA guanosine(34) transglycosylase Tgt [Rubinisphaera sp.]MBV08768.1 tRNA guanosine(34) transglycosylase Tgt [Rubinisphaera sp.]
MASFRFELQHTDPNTGARAGQWHTPHGIVDTPAFMPVGTLGTVKGLLPEQLKAAGAQMVLANTYHLALRPGADVVEELGGLHQFMNWSGPILTDSGGFQVFSLAKLSKLTDDQVVFRSHIDGSLLELSPEKAIRIQEQLGADCIMCLDECPPHDVGQDRLRAAVQRTTAWAARCRDAQKRGDQALFGIVQGGIDPHLREESAEGLLPLDFPGYAVGGLSVGEDPNDMYKTLDFTTPFLPVEKPRYLMGVGKPVDLLESIIRGIDLFDCVMPTRNGRNAMAFTSNGPVKIRNAKYQRDVTPLDPEGPSEVGRIYSKGYLRHLFVAKEMLGAILLSWHNIAFYENLVREMRQAIFENRSAEFRADQLARWGSDP